MGNRSFVGARDALQLRSRRSRLLEEEEGKGWEGGLARKKEKKSNQISHLWLATFLLAKGMEE